jgi:hypothetical protein
VSALRDVLTRQIEQSTDLSPQSTSPKLCHQAAVGRLLSGRPALILPSMAALSPDELQVVVTEYGDGIWEWEICRKGEPLPARMRDGPFKSYDVALQAGKIALQEFLELLEFEQQDGT